MSSFHTSQNNIIGQNPPTHLNDFHDLKLFTVLSVQEMYIQNTATNLNDQLKDIPVH